MKKIFKKKARKKKISYLITTTMVVGLMVCTPSDMTNVQAADGITTGITTGKTVAGLGTDCIANPTAPSSRSDAWTGSYVYFGTYDADGPGGEGAALPVKYRVLDNETNVFGGTTMLLDCDSVLWKGTAFDQDSSTWWSESNSSDIRIYLNGTFLTQNFSTVEQSGIAESTVKSHTLTTNSATGVNVTDGTKNLFTDYVALKNDKVFLLDAEDVSNGAYGYSQAHSGVEGSIMNRKKKDVGGKVVSWWLRSAYSSRSENGVVISSGGLASWECNDTSGVSPALNINLSSVLFSSVIPDAAEESDVEYKLTLLDSNMAIAGNGVVTRDGDVVTIPYTISGSNSSNATQVSVLLLDKEYTEGNTNDAEILYYGALDTSANDGTGTFTVPTELSDKVCGKDYYAYIIAEDVNGTYETDYASNPVKISIPWITKTMNLGTNGIIDPIVPTSTSDAWTGSYVYFGTYDTDGDGTADPVKYRVLDSNSTTFGGTTMLLDCDSILWAGSNPSSTFDSESNVWADSDIRTYLNETFLKSNFTTAEQKVIASSTKRVKNNTDGEGELSLEYTSLKNDEIFFLDAKEAMNESYGYSNADAATNRVKTNASASTSDWWLRSAHTEQTNYAGFVSSDGSFQSDDVSVATLGVSPAFNVNLSAVLFASACGTSKSSALTENSSRIDRTTGTEWKLTVLDTGKTIKVTDNEYVLKLENGTITVPYTYTDTATEKVNQISLMITDKAYTDDDVEILYYGALQDTSLCDGGTTGTGTFTLPSDLAGDVIGTEYHVYMLAEHMTENNETDYASTPVEITVYEEVSNVAVTDITVPVAGTALDTDANCETIRIASISPSVVWTTDGEEAIGNAAYNTTYTASVTLSLSENTIWADAVTATVNGESATVIMNESGTGTITVSYEFPATEKDKLLSITAPQSITVENGTAYADMNLPTMVDITTEGSSVIMAEVTWNTDTPASGTYDPTVLTEQMVTLSGTVTCPEGIDQNNVVLTTSIVITIKEKHECVDADQDGVCDDDACKKLINGVALRGSNLTLDGNIGLNFYFEIEENLKNTVFENETAIVRFTLADGREIDIAAKDGVVDTTAIEGMILYKYSCELYAKQMADTVLAQFIMNGEVIAAYEQSVVNYAKVIIANAEGKYSAQTIALVKAMLNYGATAQMTFSYNYTEGNADTLANAQLTEEEKKLDGVTVDIFEDYKASGMTVEGLGTFVGSNLVLESETTLKVYFEPETDITLDKLTFKVGENEVTAMVSGNYYVIAITNIEAEALDTIYAVAVSDGTTTGTFQCSVFAYCYSVLKDMTGSFSEELKNTVKALYLYNVAADAY